MTELSFYGELILQAGKYLHSAFSNESDARKLSALNEISLGFLIKVQSLVKPEGNLMLSGPERHMHLCKPRKKRPRKLSMRAG